jgi:putative ATPase
MAKKEPTENIFKGQLAENLERVQSLAARMRPSRIEEFVGQEHLLGEGRPLRKILEGGILTSLVFWGPPGTGKTTLARLISQRAGAHFEEYSAVTSKVEDIRRVLAGAEQRLGEFDRRTVIFVDEFHRFNKAQQDAFLPHLESGLLTLIGATTENPYFVLNPALRSRVSIYHFDRIGEDSLRKLLARATQESRDAGFPIPDKLAGDVAEELILLSGGDARVLLNLLELCAQLAGKAGITRDLVREAASQRQLDYSRLGTDRFDMVSAFIKSMRGSDPDAALYWLARLLAGGEAPEFLARRMVIFSAEDIGCAAPQAITVAVATADAVAFVGMPEARIPLASCAVFLATCPKSNNAYKALGKAEADVLQKPLGPVPLHLRNYDFTKEKGGEHRYKYPHDFPGHHVAQGYFPEEMEGTVYYEPSEEGNEPRIAQRLEQWRKFKMKGAKKKKPEG